jgi:hypothetical protein
MIKPLHSALHAAKVRWADAQSHHALRGTPSREMTTGRATPPNADYLGAKPLGPSDAPETP